jgi:hypothetical protein
MGKGVIACVERFGNTPFGGNLAIGDRGRLGTSTNVHDGAPHRSLLVASVGDGRFRNVGRHAIAHVVLRGARKSRTTIATTPKRTLPSQPTRRIWRRRADQSQST